MKVVVMQGIRVAAIGVRADRRGMRNVRTLVPGAETLVIASAFIGLAALVLYLVWS